MCPIAIPGYRLVGNVVTCPDGTYAPVGSSVCQICKPGYDCSTDSNRITTGMACGDGTFQEGGRKECLNCPKNYECANG